MKLFFSLLLITLNIDARDYFLITHYKDYERANIVSRLLQRDYKIPSDMIRIKEKKVPCDKEVNTFFQTCLIDGEPLKFPVLRMDLIKKMSFLWKR